MLARIQRAVDSGDTRKAAVLQKMHLTSFSAKLTAVADVNPHLKSAERARSNELVAVAGRISPFSPSPEEVKVVAASKPNGGWRPLAVFGLERAALQQLACSAIRPFHTPDSRQFALSGGGHNAAARNICDALAEGYKWFVGLDISSFYSSIERSRLNEIIPLPDKVIDHVICSTTIASIRISRVGRALGGVRLAEAAQSGISQGSRSSPLVAEIVVKDILSQFALDLRIVNVADDFGIMARSKRDAVAVQSALTRATARSPAGCFQLRSKIHPGPRRACDSFEFVGYRFRIRREIECDPSPANVARFNTRAMGYAKQMLNGRPDAIRNLRRYVKQWWRSFPLVAEYLRDPTYAFGRYHTACVALHEMPILAPLIGIAMAWEGSDYAPLPPAAELAEMAREIRRANPVHQSFWALALRRSRNRWR